MGEPAELGVEERRDTLRVARAVIDKNSGDRARPMTALVIEAERLAGGSPEAWAIDAMVLRLAQEVVRLDAEAHHCHKYCEHCTHHEETIGG